MKTKHYTPGNWTFEYCGKDTIKIFKTSDNRRITTVKVKYPVMDEANARLIASAPCLLETCKQALKFMENNYIAEHDNRDVGRIWELLETTIKQAEGN